MCAIDAGVQEEEEEAEVTPKIQDCDIQYRRKKLVSIRNCTVKHTERLTSRSMVSRPNTNANRNNTKAPHAAPAGAPERDKSSRRNQLGCLYSNTYLSQSLGCSFFSLNTNELHDRIGNRESQALQQSYLPASFQGVCFTETFSKQLRTMQLAHDPWVARYNPS